jgi:hypothetical protein
MANTFPSRLHIVFSAKNRESWISKSIKERVWEYLGSIARQNDIVPKRIAEVPLSGRTVTVPSA